MPARRSLSILRLAGKASIRRRPGRPTDNALVESFNGTLRDECLNVHWFATLGEAQQMLEAWRHDYNESRPHSALAELTPGEYARRIKDMESA